MINDEKTSDRNMKKFNHGMHGVHGMKIWNGIRQKIAEATIPYTPCIPWF